MCAKLQRSGKPNRFVAQLNPDTESQEMKTSHILLMLLTVVTFFSHATQALATDKPNIVVILCDDLGYGDLECYGHPHIKTPNLNRMAQEGIRLTDCYSAAPVCSPSRVGLLTGRSPNRAGIYNFIPGGRDIYMRASEVTIPQLLKKGGYATCMSGKWHCNGKFNSDAHPQPGDACLLYTSPSPRDRQKSRMPSSA